MNPATTLNMFTQVPHHWSRDEMASAIVRGEVVPYFQPKVDLETGRLDCTETLARWHHPRFGVLQPADFIDQMEAAGLIGELTERLLHQMLDCASRSASRHAAGYAINVSARTLEAPTAAREIIRIVRDYAVPAARITIELTETTAIRDLPAIADNLHALRNEGFRISADDFGMGYSSFEQLSQLPFTEIKIDRSFVAAIGHDHKSTLILSAMIQLAARLGLDTVAEGIETEQQLAFLKNLGCRVGQGYFLGKPMPHDELMRRHAAQGELLEAA